MANKHWIRPAESSDAPALQQLYAEIRAVAEWLPPDARRNADFARDSAGEQVLVAVAPDGMIDGLIAVWAPDAFVHHLYVRERGRRQGVAQALLFSPLHRTPRPWQLKCLCANDAALRFYRRNGWTQTGTGDGSDGPYVVFELAAAVERPAMTGAVVTRS